VFEEAGFGLELEGPVGVEEDLWPSTWPRSRVGSMMFRTRFLSSFVSRWAISYGLDGNYSGRGCCEREES
jgi:hypothetical protein